MKKDELLDRLREDENWPDEPLEAANLNLLIIQATREAYQNARHEELLNDRNYLEKLHMQIMRGVRMNRPGTPNLQVITADPAEHLESVSVPELDLSLSQVSYSR